MSVIEKLRIWGFKGAVNYLFNRLRDLRIERVFRINAKRFPCRNPQVGITVVGHLSDQGSLNKVLRDFCFSLKDSGIPFQSYDLGSHNVPDEDVADILTPTEEFRISKYTHLVEMIRSPVPDGIVPNRGRIVFWEFESGLLQGYPVLMERLGDVIGMSDFNYNYYKRVFNDRRNVIKILYPFRTLIENGLSMSAARDRFRLPQNSFVVFYNFSYKSGIDRKNPEGAIRAFAKAFSDKADARLVLKTVASDEYPERVQEIRSLVESLRISEKVSFVDEYLAQRDVLNLANACDVYLSLHRAEGFGLGIAEAMSLGKPVIVTDYSSTTEFCNASNAICIGYSMVSMRPSDTKLYVAAEKWAEPNIEEAAAELARLYNDQDLREKLGAAAKKSILEQYSLSNFRKSVLEYLSVPNSSKGKETLT